VYVSPNIIAVAEAEASDRADSLDGPWRLTCADKLMEAWASLAAAAAMAEVHRSAHGPEVGSSSIGVDRG